MNFLKNFQYTNMVGKKMGNREYLVSSKKGRKGESEEQRGSGTNGKPNCGTRIQQSHEL